MKKEDVFKCRGVMELDTTDELAVFVDNLFKEFTMETLTAVNRLLDKHSFMGTEWQAIHDCQREILSLIPKDLVERNHSLFD